jgi:hypothetical protein
LAEPLRSFLGSLQNTHIRAAATDVAGQSPSDLPIVGLRVATEQCYQAHDETWRAESALERRVFDESLLNWMEVVPIGQTFDGGNRSPSRRLHWRNARVFRLSIEQDRAGAAISIAAPILGSRQSQVMA